MQVPAAVPFAWTVPLLADLSGDGRADLVWRGRDGDQDRVLVLAGIGCTSISECQAALDALLPDPHAAADRPARRVAKRLRKLSHKMGIQLRKVVAERKPVTHSRRARKLLDRLLERTIEAITDGRLAIKRARFEAAVLALREQIPG